VLCRLFVRLSWVELEGRSSGESHWRIKKCGGLDEFSVEEMSRELSGVEGKKG
jgi:hypothetical protein